LCKAKKRTAVYYNRGVIMYEVINSKNNISLIDNDIYISFINYLDVREASIATYKTGVKRFLLYLMDQEISAPNRQDIINFVSFLETEELKATTINSYLVAVKIFFDWLEQEGLYQNVARRVKAPKVEKTFKKDYLTANQCRRILATIDTSTEVGRRDYALLALLLTTGLRTIETVRANEEDLTIRGESTVLYVQGKGKNEKADYVKIPEQTEEALRDYLCSRSRPLRKKAPLFTSTSNNNRGERLTTRSIRSIVKGRFAKAGYISDKLTAHSTRHTAAALNLIAGGSLEETSTMLRHASTETTKIYSHMIERDNNESERRVAAAIFA